MKTTLKNLKLRDLTVDAGTQTRAKLNDDIVADYAAQMEEGAKFPPLVVFHDGSQTFLADGFHRFFAAETVGFKDFPCEVHQGTRIDALKYALGANTTNGIRRTPADKRKCIEIALKEFPTLSDRLISEMCGVSNHLVAECRPQLGDSPSSPRIGADGKTRKLPAKKTPTVAPTPKPSEPETPAEENPWADEPHVTAGVPEPEEPAESETLAMLKSHWLTASKPDRAAFIKWTEQQ